MLFDTWGGSLTAAQYDEFSLSYMRKVMSHVHKAPRIVFTKGGGLWLQEMRDLDCDVLGLDWTVNLGTARALVGSQKALQGNLDPNVLFAHPEQIEAEVAKVLDSFGAPHLGAGTGPTHVFNLGHGISQHTPPDHVKVLVDAVRARSRKLRAQPSA